MAPAVGVVLPPDLEASEILEYARRTESLGFTQLWVVEDCFYKGGIAQASAILASTSQLSVGVGILPAAARNPAFAALELATLADLFPGRLTAGIGHGMPNWMRQVGAWPASPLTMLEEYLRAVRALLAGQAVTAKGRYVQLDDVKLASPPRQVPPIFAGVRGPRSLRLAGRSADGTILAEPVTLEYLRSAKTHIAAAAAHHIVVYNIAAVGDDLDLARRRARTALTSIGEPEWAPHIKPLPFAEPFAALRKSASSREEFAAGLPDDWVDQLAVVGTPETAKDRLQQLHETGADSVVLIPAGPDWRSSLESTALVL